MSSDFLIAIHALAYLRKHERYVSSEELAKNICVNPVRVRSVMTKLKKCGLIDTRNGLSGGYSFSIQDDIVTLDQIYEALKIPIFHTSWRSGDVHMDCIIASGMGSVIDDLYAQMEQVCRDYLKTVTIQDIMQKLVEVHDRKE